MVSVILASPYRTDVCSNDLFPASFVLISYLIIKAFVLYFIEVELLCLL